MSYGSQGKDIFYEVGYIPGVINLETLHMFVSRARTCKKASCRTQYLTFVRVYTKNRVADFWVKHLLRLSSTMKSKTKIHLY